MICKILVDFDFAVPGRIAQDLLITKYKEKLLGLQRKPKPNARGRLSRCLPLLPEVSGSSESAGCRLRLSQRAPQRTGELSRQKRPGPGLKALLKLYEVI